MTSISETKLWDLCSYPKEDGIDNKDYVPQLSPLLFLKGAEVNNQVNENKFLPDGVSWRKLSKIAENPEVKGEDNIIEIYEEMISRLQENDRNTVTADAFSAFRNQFRTPSVLRRLIEDIDEVFQDSSQDFFGDAYEYILERHAEDSKGAGEYFTPRPVIKAMVEVTDPEEKDNIIDPASGTGGFIIETYKHLGEKYGDEIELPSGETRKTKFATLDGGYNASNLHLMELNSETYRLGLMNLLLHGLNPDRVNHRRTNTLSHPPRETFNKEFDTVLANPPYGSGVTVKYTNCPDTTSPELNFLKLIMDSLSSDGQAAVILPEGVLFGTGVSKTIRKSLFDEFNIQCVMALPENSFQPYTNIKANVLFFERDSDGTDEFWMYDARSDFEGIKKSNPLTYDKHLSDFVDNWRSKEESDKYFRVDFDEVDSSYELHLKKYKEFKTEGHRPPDEIAQDIKNELNTIETTLDTIVGDKR